MISYKDLADVYEEVAEELDQLGEKRTKLGWQIAARKFMERYSKAIQKDRKSTQRQKGGQ